MNWLTMHMIKSPAHNARTLLINAVRFPETLPQLTLTDWDLLLRIARSKRLLGRLHADLSRLELLESIPTAAAAQLQAAHNLVRHRHTVLTWELDRILWALNEIKVPIIALKGTAYIIAKLPNSAGRFFADLDILVPISRIAEVEQKLTKRGWLKTQLSPYDDRYYRLWMHEIPPLRHRERESEIDIHHALLPRTSRYGTKLDTMMLFSESYSIKNSQVRVLGAQDMVLHALVHLLLEGDPNEGLRLRDLIDVADLLCHFGSTPKFWKGLVLRAQQFQLERILYYGLRYSQRLLAVQIPNSVLQSLTQSAPKLPIRWLMDWLMPLALLPEHPDYPQRIAVFARWLLYLRAHWLRMPFLLLVRHLTYKSWLRMRGTQRHVEIKPQDLQQL
ncbi:nucleotidyltransferase domain-containing protein [Chromatium okenii]|nr:nucleotidyltransferase family protein [Chromatium okenii]